MPELVPSEDALFDIDNPWQSLSTRITNDISQSRQQQNASSFKNHLLYGTPAVLAGAAETFGTSLGFLDEGDVQKTLEGFSTGLSNYYKLNQEGAQAIGDLATMFIPGMLGVKALRAGSLLFRGLSKGGTPGKMLNALFASGKSRDTVMEAVRARDMYLTGSKVGQLDLLSDPVRQALIKNAAFTRVSDVIKESIAFEAGVFATMNDSQTLYPDEFTTMELVALNSVFPALASGIEFAMIKRVARQSADTVARTAFQSNNQLDLPLEDVIYRPGNRDIGLVIDSLAAVSAQANREATTEIAGKTNFNRAAISFEESMKTQIQKMFTESPLKGITTGGQATFGAGVVNTAFAAQKQNPFTLAGTLSLEHLPVTFDEIGGKIATRDGMVVKLQNEIDELQNLNPEKVNPPKAGDTITVFDPAGNPIDLPVVGVSDAGTVIVRDIDGIEHIVGDAKFDFADPRNPNYKIVWREGEPSIASLSDKQLDEVTVRAKQRFDAAKKDGRTDSQLNRIRDLNAINFERKRRAAGSAVLPKAKVLNSANTQEEVIEKITEKQLQKTELEGLNYYVLEKDGTLIPALDRKPTFSDSPIPLQVEASPILELSFLKAKVPNQAGQTAGRLIGVGSDFRLNLPGKRTVGEGVEASFEMLTPFQRSAVYTMLGKQVTRSAKGGVEKAVATQLKLSEHYTTLDAVVELHGKLGDDLFTKFELPEGIRSIEDIEYLSVNKKFAEYRKLRDAQNKTAENLFSVKPEQRLNHIDIQRMLNLPGSIAADGAPHPLLEVFEGLYRSEVNSLDDVLQSLDDVFAATYEVARFPELMKAEGLAPKIKLRGSMLLHDDKLQPGFVIKKQLDPDIGSREQLINGMTIQRSDVIHKMANSEAVGADLVQNVFNSLATNPNTKFVQDVPAMIQGSQRGTGTFFQQSFAAFDNPTLSSTVDVMENTVRRFRAQVGKEWEKHSPVFNSLKAPQNKVDLEALNIFTHARRQGWDLANDVVPIENGLTGFKLKKTVANKDRFKALYGTDLPEDALLPTPVKQGESYRPLGVTPRALEGIDSIRQLGLKVQTNVNHLRKTVGQGQGNVKEWWVPPKNFSRKETVFLIDAAGQVKGTIGAPTLGAARRQAEKELANSNEKLFVVDHGDVDRYLGLQDEAFFRMLDFTDPLKQTGRAKGTSVFQVVETGPDVLTDMLSSLSSNFESILRRSTTLYFEPQINLARKLYKSAGSPDAKKGRTVWQQYLSTLFDNPALNPNEITGRAYYALESIYDDFLNAIWQKKQNLTTGLKNAPDKADEKIFKQMEEKFGDFNPFKDTADFFERTQDLKLPPSAKSNLGKLNRVTTLLTLRFMEVGHSLLTLSSLGATLPGVIKALQPTDVERLSEVGMKAWQTRVQAFGVPLPDGKNAMFSPVRAMTSTFHYMFTDEGHKIWQKASDLGYMDQAIAEQMKTLTAPTQGYMAQMLSKYGKFTTFLSDESEKLARGISFMHGYTIAKRGLGLQSDEAAFAFAHKLANQTIGNYSPTNRPKIFQGAAGMPIGLFMTFMWNYYQRIFDYATRGQSKALGWQMFSQAAIFGASTVPGFSQFNDFFASNYDGSVNIVDGIQNKFGTEVAEWFLQGTLSNLPKLFGADDGIGLYTRGDVTFRNVPTIFTAQDSPAIKMIGNALGAISETAQMFKQGGASDQQIAEIIANYSTNRFVRNMAQMYTGDITDRRGQLVGETPSFSDVMKGDIQNEMALIARVTGMRTLKEARSIEAHMRVRQTEYAQAYQLSQLRDRTRALSRKGDISESEYTNLFSKYLKYGGRPESFARWLTEQHMAGQVDKTTRKLLDISDDPTRSYDVNRLLSAMVMPDNDPEF